MALIPDVVGPDVSYERSDMITLAPVTPQKVQAQLSTAGTLAERDDQLE
jgi:hypothetical protein